MKLSKKKNLIARSAIGIVIGVISAAAQAVPSFERQTGLGCSSCHTVFPQLTPFGREFKLGGYVLNDGQEKKLPPVAAGLRLSQTNIAKRGPGVDDSKGRVPQDFSLYYAGRLASKLGTFTQVSYKKDDKKTKVEMLDVRYADTAVAGGAPLTYGVTLNNMPTLQDVRNSTPAFMFPYEPTAVAPTPATGMGLSDPLAMKVAGLGAYAWWNNKVYAEVSGYRSRSGGEMGEIDGIAPYWRLSVQGTDEFSVGVYGISSKVKLDPMNPMAMMIGESQRYRDVAVDAQYQSIGDSHIFATYATLIKRKVQYDQTMVDAMGNPMVTPFDTNVDIARINGSYHFQRKYGVILGYFDVSGDADANLYPMEDVTGSASGSPDSAGYTVELNYLPLQTVKLALQYTAYDKFNGSGNDYDGSGRNASDNNTLFMTANMMF